MHLATLSFHLEIGSFWGSWVNLDAQDLHTKIPFLKSNAPVGSSLRSPPFENTEYSLLKYFFTSEKHM